jgi:nucleoside-diphosphate-sugar epimerase
MPKSLVTGGAGFIGLHLSRLLKEHGHTVTLVDNFARAVRDPEIQAFAQLPGVTLKNYDLLQPGSLDAESDDYDYVFHLAALLGVQNVRSRPYEVLVWNARMLEEALNFARRQKNLSRFLFSSTSEVYAGTLHYFGMEVPTPETTPLALMDLAEPRVSYMLSKIYGEELCRFSGVPFTIFRVHNAYGPRMGLSHVVPELLKKAFSLDDGGKLEVFSTSHSRSFCFISDLVELIRRMAETPACTGQVLNCGSQGPEITIGDVAEIIIRTVGKQLTIVPMPETPGSPQRRAPDMTKTAELTGYDAVVSPEEGIRRTFEWYRDRVFSGAQVSAL